MKALSLLNLGRFLGERLPFLIYTSARETFGSASKDLGEFRTGLLGNWLGPEAGLRTGGLIGATTGLGILLLK